MKKLFTTFLLMGVALTGWANITSEWDGSGELKIVYHEGDNLNDVNNTLGNYNGQVKKLVLEGVFTNAEFSSIGDKIGDCAHSDGIVLDLSGCSNLVSKVVRADGTYDSDIDWVTTEHMFLPNSNPITVRGTATKITKYYESWGTEYTGGETLEQHDDGLWYVPGTTWNPKTAKDVFVDENGNQLPSNATVTDNGNETYSYEYTYTPDATPFKLGNFKKKIIGLYLPNSENFNYVPDGLCKDMNGVGDNGNLKELGLGDHIEWIGQEAFCNCISLKDPVFPATMKVFAGDCFKNCNSFTKVDLSILPKIQIVDYMAFGSASEDATVATSNLAEFILPTNNTSLKYFANYVVRGTKVTELDFSGCNGIVNFAHDGKATFGEFSENWTSYWTFYACPELTTVTLPRKLSYLTKKAFDTCPKLQSVTFLGEAEYDMTTCVEGGTNTIKNPLVIDEDAFAKDNALSEVNFCNRVTVIGARAFSKTSLREVRIPASVQLIGTMAFEDQTDAEGNMTLKTVIFEEIDTVNCKPCKHAQTLIKAEAFLENTAISDVYVNTVVDIDCENHAFPFEVTFAQGDAEAASTGQAATLHFPAGHEAHYVNLNHGLDNETAADPGKFQKWLVDHLAAAQDQSTGYGWYEFINTGSRSIDPKNPDPEYDPDPENPEELPLILRTFSDPNYARIVPDGMRAYVVNNVQKDATNNTVVLTLQRLSVIPAQTGVVLFGQPNSTSENGKHILTMSVVQFEPGNGQPLRRDYWDLLASADMKFKNYLMPIIGNAHWRTPAVEGVYDEAHDTFEDKDLLTVNPYEPYQKGATVEWRNFALNRMSATENLQFDKDFNFDETVDNYAGFFRILPNTYKSGYAYLHLSVDEYDDPTGAECVVTEDADYFKEYNTSGSAYDPRGMTGFKWWNNPNTWTNMIDGWGVRKDKFNKPKAVQFLGELEDTDGMVQMVVPENKMGEIFSITGMKVTNPNKGIYIQNGKKIIVK